MFSDQKFMTENTRDRRQQKLCVECIKRKRNDPKPDSTHAHYLHKKKKQIEFSVRGSVSMEGKRKRELQYGSRTTESLRITIFGI